MDRPPEVREAAPARIDEELTKLGQQFSKNISEDVRSIEAPPGGSPGCRPTSWRRTRRTSAGSSRSRPTRPDYNPFMTYAADDALRRELYVACRSRGDQHNEGALREILKLRAEKASLLGFTDWADYITADKMIGSGARARASSSSGWALARSRAERDYQELLRKLQEVQPGATAVADWQKSWLENLVKKEVYQVDSGETRRYFPYGRVLAGLLEITSEIFDLQYTPVSAPVPRRGRGRDGDARRWHESVLVYDVVRGEARLGRIFLDMHPREGKYKHAAQFPLKDGVRGVQLPEGVLVCNFADPRRRPGAPRARGRRDDVPRVRAPHAPHPRRHQRWITQSGVATEWDFVEAPSQMFEEWAWSFGTLARFARHYETGAVIPGELVEKMRRADKFGLGTATVQQIFYASISLAFHRADPHALDQLAEVQRLQKRYTPFAYVPGTRFHASFGHLVGYSAMYYTYQWSLVIAKDLLTPFEASGLMARDVTFAYRDKVLVPGGSRDAIELVRDFLGRDYDFAAYERFLAE